MERKFTDIIGLSPLIILFANSFGLIPEQYEGWASVALIVIAVLHCVALAKCGEHAMGLALFPALFCILMGVNAVYDWGKYDYGTFAKLFEGFCCFICGVWIFAYDFKNKKK